EEQDVAEAVLDAPAAQTDQLGDRQRHIRPLPHQPKKIFGGDDQNLRFLDGLGVLLAGAGVEDGQFPKDLPLLNEREDGFFAVGRDVLDLDPTGCEDEDTAARLGRGIDQGPAVKGADQGAALQPRSLLRGELLEQVAALQIPEFAFHPSGPRSGRMERKLWYLKRCDLFEQLTP